MQQILMIHGGDSFDSYNDYWQDLINSEIDYDRLKPKKRWKDWLINELPKYEFLTPEFPNSANAQYKEWKVKFEKILPFLKPDAILIGHSLGGSLLLKYFTENSANKKFQKIIMLASPFGDEPDIGSFKTKPTQKFLKAASQTIFLHSKDDLVVPFDAYRKFQKLYPTATFYEFEDKFHFIDETFPELKNIIKK